MHRALERQLDAFNVDLDSEAGWVRFALRDPVNVDFREIADTLDSASYELFGMEIVVQATHTVEKGEPIAVFSPTGQKLAISKATPWTGKRLIRGMISDWELVPKLTWLPPLPPPKVAGDVDEASNAGR